MIRTKDEVSKMEEEILTQLIMQRPGTPAEKIFSLRFSFFSFRRPKKLMRLHL